MVISSMGMDFSIHRFFPSSERETQVVQLMDIRALMAKAESWLPFLPCWEFRHLVKLVKPYKDQGNGQNKSHQAPHPHIQAVDRGGKEAFQLFFIEGVDLR